MTEKTNLFPNLIRFRETNRLKMAIAASIMLWCATPQQAAADTYEKHEIASVQQQKVKTTGTVLDQNGEAMIGVSVKVKDNATMGTIPGGKILYRCTQRRYTRDLLHWL